MTDEQLDDTTKELEELLNSAPEQIKAPVPPKPSKPKPTVKSKGKPETKPSGKPAAKVPRKPVATSPKTPVKSVEPIKASSDVKPGVMIDDRKLTNKGKESLRSRWSAEASGESRDGLMSGLRAIARDKFGAERVFGSRAELEQLAIGIPMPSLALEYLLANNIFPVNSLVMLAGSWGCCKSALSYEIFRWFHEQNGMITHIDTEDKFDADFACDIMQVPRQSNPFMSNRAKSIELMQDMLTFYIGEAKKVLKGTKEEPGPGNSVPCCFCIDSLAGASSEEVQEKILKEGHAGRSHPVGVLKNTTYLTGIKPMFENWPFTLLVVNHLKEKTDDMGNTRQYTLGGQSYNFHESFELRNSVFKQSFKNTEWEGIGIRIQCAKNSFGPTGRVIKTRFLWWCEDDPETGEPRDRFMWDWNWSLITLLHELDGMAKQRLIARGVRVEVRSAKAELECLANVRALGMGKDEYLPFQQVGQMIQDDEEVSKLIREALNIKQRRQLIRPYDEIVNDYLKSAE